MMEKTIRSLEMNGMSNPQQKKRKKLNRSFLAWRGVKTTEFPTGKIIASREWPDGTRTVITLGGEVFHVQ